MQLNKSFTALVLIFLSILKLGAQPSPKSFNFTGEISISDNNKKVSFTTSDSLNFTSLDSKIKLSAYRLKIGQKENRDQYKFKHIIDNRFQIRGTKTAYYNGKKFSAFVFLVEIKKPDGLMLVYFDFTKEPKSNTELGQIDIPFQKGKFKITNSKKPKLIRIRND